MYMRELCESVKYAWENSVIAQAGMPMRKTKQHVSYVKTYKLQLSQEYLCPQEKLRNIIELWELLYAILKYLKFKMRI